MDLVIENALVPDFEKLTFEKLYVGIKDGKIRKLSKSPIKAKERVDAKNFYLSPGLIDCHCHIESTHLLPSGFAKAVSRFGTLHVVADCHEIANVFGVDGVRLFIENSKQSEININFAIPSCVPATDFATSGGRIDVDDVEKLLKDEKIVALGELMNVPGVVAGDERFIKMIQLTKKAGKRVNGHAPHLDSQTLKKYIERGVEDDHESYTYDELKQKIELGLFVFLREGSTEFTEDRAYKVIKEYPERVAFCTDDKSVGDILKSGHINYNLKKAVKNGIEPILALKAASYNGLRYYGLNEYSEVKPDKKAYLVLFDKEFNAKKLIIDGKIARKKDSVSTKTPDRFKHSIHVKTPLTLPDIKIKNLAIKVNDGSLITEKMEIEEQKGEFNLGEDLLKMVVVERYGHGFSSACFVHGFGLKRGAMATSLAHDCHNIVAVGTSSEELKRVIEKVIELSGGQVVSDGERLEYLKLEVGGITTEQNPEDVAKRVESLKKLSHSIGCKLTSPLDMLSFMALEVIPHIKLTDRGLFDVDKFSYIR